MLFEERRIDLYRFSRITAASFLILNSVHRIIFPKTGMVYMPSEVFSIYPVSQMTMVFLVMSVSLLCAAFILADKYTFQASGVIASGILFVVVILLLQTPHIGILPTENGMMFFDVAMRDFVVVAFFVNLSIMAKRRKMSELKETNS